MNPKIPSAGDIIDARCTRCRAVLNHRIVAMVDGRVVRVECNTCGGVHNYYAPGELKTRVSAGPTTKKKEAVSGKSRTDAASRLREDWQAACGALEKDHAVLYDMTGRYRLGDVIDHSTFGLGIVKTVMKPNKIEVLFQEGTKLLRCAL